MLFMRKLFLLVVMTLTLLGCDKAPVGGQRPPSLVSVVTVEPHMATIFANLPGRVDAVRDAQIRARVTGIVKKITFVQGGDVKAGDVLFEIDPAPYQAALSQAKADVQRAKADALATTALAKRYAPLVKINAVSRQEYDDAQARAAQAAASVLGAQAQLQLAEINLGYTQVTSPIDGRVGRALVTEGALVEASTATQMALVQQISPIYIDVNQSSAQLAKLRLAFKQGSMTRVSEETAKVNVLLEDGSTYSHPGRLMFTGFTVNPGTGEVVLRVEVINPELQLLPGMFVRVRVEQGTEPNALTIPQQAIQRSADGKASVYIVKEGAAKIVPVKVGSITERGIMITEGLVAGDQVIVEGLQKIRPGAPVNAKPWQAGS
jgi:membrane fusion protein (multidrug efflux system)